MALYQSPYAPLNEEVCQGESRQGLKEALDSRSPTKAFGDRLRRE